MNSNIKGITIELNGDTTNLKSGFADVEAKAKDVGNQLKLVNQQLKLDPGNIDLAAQKLQLLRQQGENSAEKLQKLRDVQDQIAEQYRKGVIDESQWVAFQQELAKTEIQLNKTENQIAKISGAASDAGKSQDAAAESSSNWADVLKGNLLSTAITKGFEKLLDIAKQTAEGFKDIAVNAAAVGDSIDKQSQRLGMTMESYQEWGYILSQNGTDISTLTGGMRKLTDVIDGAKSGSDSAVQALSRVGLSVDELNKLSGEEQFSAVVKALQSMDDESERNAAASDLLGRSYMELIPLLNQSADSVEILRQRAHDTNQLMDSEGVAAAVNYTDAMDTLNRSLDGIKNRMGGEVLQAVADVTNGITDLINGIDGGDVKIEKGIDDLLDSIEKAGDEALDVIDTVVAFAGDKAPDIINTIAERIKDDAPKLADRAADIGQGIANAIADSLPAVGSAAGTIGVSIVTGTFEAIANFPQLAEKLGEVGAAFCGSVADGIVNYDWASFSRRFAENMEKALRDAFDFLAPVIKQIQVWMDNIFTGGEVYGGDVNNVQLWASDDFLDKYHQGAEAFADNLADGWNIIRESYESGKEMLAGSVEEIAESVVTETEAGTKAVEEAGSNFAEAIKASSEKTDKEAEKAKKAAEKAQKEAERAAEKQRKEQEKTAENARKAAVKNIEKEVDEVYDTFEKKYKELEKLKDAAYKKFMSIGGDVFSFTKDKDGNTTATIEDIKQQMKDMKAFYDDVKKLKDSGASQELISEILSMDNDAAKEFADYLADMDKAEFDYVNDLYKQKGDYAKELSDMLYSDDEKALDNGLTKALGSYFNGSDDALKYSDDFIAALKSRDSDFRKAFEDVIGGNINALIGIAGSVYIPDAKSVAVPTVAAAAQTSAAVSETASAQTVQGGTAQSGDSLTRILAGIYNTLTEISAKLDKSTAVTVKVTPDINKIAKEVSAYIERDKRIKST